MIQGKTGAGGRTLYSFSSDLNFTIVRTKSFHLFFGQICALLNLFFAQNVPYSNKTIGNFFAHSFTQTNFRVFNNNKYLK